MPITGHGLYGDFSAGGSLRTEDRRLLRSDKMQRKIKDVLVDIPIPVHLHFVNLPYIFEIDALPRFFRSADPFFPDQKIGHMSAAKFKRIYDVQLSIARNALNLVFIENEGENRLPFTPWIIAHRLYHALSLAVQYRPDTNHRRLGEGFTRLLTAGAKTYRCRNRFVDDDRRLWPSRRFGKRSTARDDILKLLAEETLDTQVCRNRRLNNHLEAIAEAFAQWCVTGSIRTKALPRRIVWSEQAFEASAQEARELDQNLLGFMRQCREIFAVELAKVLHAGQRLLVL
jgi:hypothetical protein